MYSSVYFVTTPVAKALVDVRSSTRQLPASKIARIHQTSGDVHADTVYNATRLGDREASEYALKTDLGTGGGGGGGDSGGSTTVDLTPYAKKNDDTVNTQHTVYNALRLNGKTDTEFTTEVSLENKLWWDSTYGYWTTDNANRFKGRPLSDFALRYVAGPDQSLHTVYNTTRLIDVPGEKFALQDEGTPETQHTVANANYLGFYPADAYALKSEIGTSTPKAWNAITNYEGSVARHTIPFGGAEDRIGFTREPYDPRDPDRPFPARDLVVYWNVNTPLTTLQADLAHPLRMPDGNPRVKTPAHVAFELVNPKDIPLEVMMYEGGTFVAKTKYNTGTTLTPNNRDYVRIAPGGWVTFKWWTPVDNTKWFVFGDLV